MAKKWLDSIEKQKKERRSGDQQSKTSDATSLETNLCDWSFKRHGRNACNRLFSRLKYATP